MRNIVVIWNEKLDEKFPFSLIIKFKESYIINIYIACQVIAAKIIVYADEEEEYFSFIFLEAYSYLKEWMEYRQATGEVVTDNS